MNKKRIILVLTMIAITISGCTLFSPAGGRTVTLEGDQLAEVLVYAEPKTENVLQGLITDDYDIFSRDFDNTMKNGMDKAAFDSLKDTLNVKLGEYRSQDVLTVLQDNKYTIVIYQLRFDKDDQVTMRVVLDKDEPHLVTGLWFDSPELRKQ
jgi:hypothetical protein